MIAAIQGQARLTSDGRCHITPDGIGLMYEVLLPAYLISRLESEHQPGDSFPTRLHTLQDFESRNQGATLIPRLIGFATAEERAFFELFTSVKGLGVRRALRALAVQPSDIAAAIASGDVRALVRLPEVGKKVAETIILELRDKASPYAAGSGSGDPEGARSRIELKPGGPVSIVQSEGPLAEAVVALVALGEVQQEAERRLLLAIRRAGMDPSALAADATAEDLLRLVYTPS